MKSMSNCNSRWWTVYTINLISPLSNNL